MYVVNVCMMHIIKVVADICTTFYMCSSVLVCDIMCYSEELQTITSKVWKCLGGISNRHRCLRGLSRTLGRLRRALNIRFWVTLDLKIQGRLTMMKYIGAGEEDLLWQHFARLYLGPILILSYLLKVRDFSHPLSHVDLAPPFGVTK